MPGAPRADFDKFLSTSVKLSKLLAQVSNEKVEVTLEALNELVVTLREAVGYAQAIKAFLEDQKRYAAADEEDVSHLQRVLTVMGAVNSDIHEARIILRKRGIISSL